MFTRFINWPVFVSSFIIGLLFVHLSAPSTTTVYVFPTPDNTGLVEYVDKANNCFQYISNKISCPSDKNLIKDIPVQMGHTKEKNKQTNVNNLGES